MLLSNLSNFFLDRKTKISFHYHLYYLYYPLQHKSEIYLLIYLW